MSAPKHRKSCQWPNPDSDDGYCETHEGLAALLNRQSGWTAPTHRAEVPTQTAGAA